MRVDVEKVLMLGPASNRERFFKHAQDQGIVEFIGPVDLEVPGNIQNFIDALHVLRQMVPVKQAPQADYKSASVLARAVIEYKEKLEHLLEQKRITEKEISRVEIFGEFSVSNLHALEQESKRIFQFFFAKQGSDVEGENLIFVGSSYGLDYYVAINAERTPYEGLVEIIIERSVNELRYDLANMYRDIDHLETQLATLAHQKDLLKKGLTDALNRHHLNQAKDKVEPLLEARAFSVEGWVPKNKRALLDKIVDELDMVIEVIAVEEKDRTPTYLENKRFGRLGEDLVNIYDTPAKDDRDPSLWVFIAFGMFFSMIVADAGYGILIFGFTLFLYFKFGKKPGLARRVILLAMSLSIGCIVWGVMLTSFFGIPIAPDNPMRKISVVDWAVKRKANYLMEKKNSAYQEIVKSYPKLKDAKTTEAFLMGVRKETDTGDKYVIYDTFTDNILIELAIFIGTIHILISFLRYLDRNWAGLGWVIFLIGGYLYFPQVIKATSFIYFLFDVPQAGSPIIGLYMLFIGIGLATLLAIIQHKWAGIAEPMQVIQVFADVMSYLRIYALSLAGMIMGTTFDHIGASMPIYFGIFVFLAGHTVNFVLALMGGVIHGLRLNFIEWYHYSFEGGGRQFQPLSLLQID